MCWVAVSAFSPASHCQRLSSSAGKSRMTASGRSVQRVTGFFERPGGKNLEAGSRQQLLVQQQVDRIVVDHEHGRTQRVKLQAHSWRIVSSSAAWYDRGMTAKNVDPTPSWLCSKTLPPSKSASFQDKGSPSPVPFTRF